MCFACAGRADPVCCPIAQKGQFAIVPVEWKIQETWSTEGLWDRALLGWVCAWRVTRQCWADKPWRQQSLLPWECVLSPLAQGAAMPGAPAKAMDSLLKLARTLTSSCWIFTSHLSFYWVLIGVWLHCSRTGLEADALWCESCGTEATVALGDSPEDAMVQGESWVSTDREEIAGECKETALCWLQAAQGSLKATCGGEKTHCSREAESQGSFDPSVTRSERYTGTWVSTETRNNA